MHHDGVQPEPRPATRTFNVRFGPLVRPTDLRSRPESTGDGEIEFWKKRE
jgi:hypothetical protein